MDIINIPELAVSSNSRDEDIKSIVACIRPTWQSGHIHIKELSGGLMNTMFHVWLPSLPSKDGLVFRIFNPNMMQFNVKENEITGLRAAYMAGCGAPMYARFGNGLVMGYVPGRTLRFEDMLNPNINKHIAASIAKFNHITPTDLSMLTECQQYTKPQKSFRMFKDKFRGIILNPPGTTRELTNDEKTRLTEAQLPSSEAALQELEMIWDFQDRFKIPLVYSHNDIHSKNIIFNEESKTATLVDFEEVSFNHMNFDVGKFFFWKPYSYLMHWATKEQCEAPLEESFIKKFCSCYLESKLKLEGNLSQDISDADIAELVLLIEIGQLVFDCLLMAVCPAIAVISGTLDDVDAIGVAIIAKNRYFSNKEQVMSQGMDYLKQNQTEFKGLAN